MRALAVFGPILGIVASVSTIYWNLVMRKRLMEARIAKINRTDVESNFARAIRYALTALVAMFAASLLILGMVITTKTLWELFA